MRAFNTLFGRQVPIYRRPSTHIGLGSIIGLAGIGYMVYRYLQTPAGQQLQTDVADQVKNVTKKWSKQADEMHA